MDPGCAGRWWIWHYCRRLNWVKGTAKGKAFAESKWVGDTAFNTGVYTATSVAGGAIDKGLSSMGLGFDNLSKQFLEAGIYFGFVDWFGRRTSYNISAAMGLYRIIWTKSCERSIPGRFTTRQLD